MGQIIDGLSQTMMVGEKYLNADNYTNGSDAADDNSDFIGIDRDVNGYAASATASLTNPMPIAQFQPRQDMPGLGLNWTFGSAHSAGFNMAFCDNSVRTISYDVDFVVFFQMGGRNDATPGSVR